MSIVITALLVMAASLGAGALMTAAARRAARARGDEEAAARMSMTGTPGQRRRSLWIASVLGIVGVAAALLGAGAGLVGILVTLSLALAGQAAVLELLDRRPAAGDGGEEAQAGRKR